MPAFTFPGLSGYCYAIAINIVWTLGIGVAVRKLSSRLGNSLVGLSFFASKAEAFSWVLDMLDCAHSRLANVSGSLATRFFQERWSQLAVTSKRLTIVHVFLELRLLRCLQGNYAGPHKRVFRETGKA